MLVLSDLNVQEKNLNEKSWFELTNLTHYVVSNESYFGYFSLV